MGLFDKIPDQFKERFEKVRQSQEDLAALPEKLAERQNEQKAAEEKKAAEQTEKIEEIQAEITRLESELNP